MSVREGHNEPSGYARLRIRVIAGINLAKKDIFGASDPYVRGYLYNVSRRNYDSPCFQTKTIKKTLNPKWEEEFVMTVNPRQHKLLFEVFDENRLTRDDFLGEVPIVLAETTILHEQSGVEIPPRDFILQPRSPRSRVRGHLRLYLAYVPENEEDQLSDGQSSESSQETLTNVNWEGLELVTNEDNRNSLPAGWEERIDLNGRTYYLDHNTRTSSWQRPDGTVSPGTPQQRRQEQEAAAVVFRNRRHVSQDEPVGSNFEAITLAGPSGSANSTSAAVISVSELLPVASRRSRIDDDEDDDDDDEPLPVGWNQSVAPNGRIFFIDHNSRITTWDDPRKMKTHSNGPSPSQSKRPSYDASNDTLGPLPAGWEERITDDNRIFYVDHTTKRTQWEDPRLKKLGGPAMRYSREYKRKYDNFRAKLRRPENAPNKFDIKVSRANVLEDSYRSIMAVKKPELLKTKLWIEFDGEAGLDYAGISKEWFYILSKEMFNPYYGLFEYSAIDDYTLQINPQSGLANEEHLSYFRFIGRICGMAVYHGRLIDAYFIHPFYKMMLKRQITLKDMESVDSEYFNSLQWILENEPDCLELTFSVDEDVFGEKKEVELKPNGQDIKVTNENKAEYIQLIIKYRFSDRVKRQMSSFMEGFNDLIPQQLLAMFNPNELELLLAGLQDIDVNDWKANTKYKGSDYNPNHPIIVDFWKVVYLFNNEQRSRLLQFVTGTSRVPMNGFAELYGSNGHQPFTIEKWGTPADLPRAHTCFNRLDLPPYPTIEDIRAKLLFAIENTEGFDGVD